MPTATRIRTLLILAGAAVYHLGTLIAQSPPAPALAAPDAIGPRFEVALVKRNKSTDRFISIGSRPGGRFEAINVTLRRIIAQAYRLQDFQLVGGPDWLRTERFDINAKAEGEVPPAPPGTTGPMHLMTRALLADRFELVVHEEEREMPVYALMLARDDKRLGPQLKPSSFDCDARRAALASGVTAPPAGSDRPVCGMRLMPNQLVGDAFTISGLPTLLAPIVQRTVIDRTGLIGGYDIELNFAPDTPASSAALSTSSTSGDSLPSIFTALQEQLGLKLEAQRAPVKVLVIDSVQLPIED